MRDPARHYVASKGSHAAASRGRLAVGHYQRFNWEHAPGSASYQLNAEDCPVRGFIVLYAGLLVLGSHLLSAQSPQLSTTCKFTQGPRAGQTQVYAGAKPLPVGGACKDGQGSTGVVVADANGSSKGSVPAGRQVSTTCKFTKGPRAGQTQSYPGAKPIPVGAPCRDAQGSTGAAVADANGSGTAPVPGGQQVSTTCKFTQGPRAGQTQSFPGAKPIPVGTACNDGKGNAGAAVADGSGPGKAPVPAAPSH